MTEHGAVQVIVLDIEDRAHIEHRSRWRGFAHHEPRMARGGEQALHGAIVHGFAELAQIEGSRCGFSGHDKSLKHPTASRRKEFPCASHPVPHRGQGRLGG